LLSADVRHRIGYYPRALAAARYIQEHLDDDLVLDAIAEVAGMSPNSFSRYFAGKIGITIASLTKTMRIERALEHMEAGERVVTRLAERTGYQSHCTFSRAFKSLIGVSPTEYTRQLVAPSVERAS
jgi:transcriptional regulator GlxA family with amidase domain